MNKLTCPNCGNQKRFYKLKDGRLKCSLCKKYFTPQKKSLHINKKDLEKIIELLLLEKPTNYILEQVKISKYKLLKIKKVLRGEIEKDYQKILKIKINNFSKHQSTFEKCCQILEKPPKSFLTFLKTKIEHKGGIRENHLKDFVFEYYWKWKNSKKSLKEKKEIILKKLESKIWF